MSSRCVPVVSQASEAGSAEAPNTAAILAQADCDCDAGLGLRGQDAITFLRLILNEARTRVVASKFAFAFALMLSLLAAPIVRAEDAPAERIILPSALIRSIERAPFDSGIFATWNHWNVESGGTSRDLFSLRMSAMDRLPIQGQRCEIQYHYGKLGGSVGPGLETDTSWAMVDHFTCVGEPAPPGP